MAQWNEGLQLDGRFAPNTQLVTITIGGNDIKFGEFGRKCVFDTCRIGSEAYNTSRNEIDGALSSKLESVYKKILQQMPNAKVYVAGYPQVIANKQSTDPSDSRCAYMHGGDWGDAQAARDIVTKLNQKIQQKVNDVRRMDSGFNNRIFYIPLDGDDSPFKGHEMCGTASSSWFHNIDQAVYDESYAFHPNKMGQEGYATVIASTINAVT